jgi:hypothetical protein
MRRRGRNQDHLGFLEFEARCEAPLQAKIFTPVKALLMQMSAPQATGSRRRWQIILIMKAVGMCRC